MSSIDTKHAVLTAHPSTPNHAVCSLGVQLRAEVPDFLVFQYSRDADMSRVRVPLSGAGGRADALWQHTCFEAFVAPEDAPTLSGIDVSVTSVSRGLRIQSVG